MFNLVVASINHEKSNLSIREKVSFTKRKKEFAYNKIKNDGVLKEVIILSTCNRCEIYGIITEKQDISYIYDLFLCLFKVDIEELKENLEVIFDDAAIDHIYKVAGGFKSLVIGEDQILGQLKDAYYEALEHKVSGRFLNKLALSAVTFGKKFRSETGISNTPTSVSSVAVKLLKNKYDSMKDKTVLVIGLGEINTIVLKYLEEEHVKKIYVANRTVKSLDFYNKNNIHYISYDKRYDAIKKADIVISCTGAPHYVIHEKEFNEIYSGKEMTIIDLAVPRDIDKAIEEYTHIDLVVIDDLKEICNESLRERRNMMDQGIIMMKEEIDRYITWRNYSISNNPLISEIAASN